MRSFARVAALAITLFSLSWGGAHAQIQPPAPPPLEYYGSLPAIEDAVISPNGTYTAMLMTVRGERAITILDAAGQPVKQLVVGEAKVRGIDWVGEEAILVRRTETGRLPRQYYDRKAEFARGNVIPLDDRHPVVSIFANQRFIANVITAYYGIRKVDGRWYGFFGGLRRGRVSGDRNRLLDRATALFRVDLLTGDAEAVRLPDDFPSIRDWLVDSQGEIGAQLQLDAQNGNWRIESAGGTTIALGNQPRGQISMLGFTADESAVIYSAFDEADRRYRRYSVPLSGGSPQELWADTAINRYVYQPFTANILGIRRADRVIDLADDTKEAILSETLDAFSFATYREVTDFTPDFSALIAYTSGNYDSGTWYRINGTTSERSIIGFERPALQGPIVGTIERIRYKAHDGLEIEGILTLPPGREAKDLPAIILPHGGPTAHDVAAFDWWAQAFASRGYAVLQPNFRGSTGRGSRFVEAGDGEWGKKMQTDKSDGLMALSERGIVDASRACIVGASYGGYAALAGVTLQRGIYRCAVSVNGVSQLRMALRDFRSGMSTVFTRSTDKQFGKDYDFNALSPADNAKRADAPILLIHGRATIRWSRLRNQR